MGLDMYLKKKIYLGFDYEHNVDKEKESKIVINGKEYPTEDLSEISYAVMYWRKANQIHDWFVREVQEGEDDCKEYYVSKKQLEELLDDCKKVKDSLQLPLLQIEGEKSSFLDVSVAEDLLPTSSGFFFGDTEYDEYYLEDINNTIKGLKEILLKDNKNAEFYYRSSW